MRKLLLIFCLVSLISCKEKESHKSIKLAHALSTSHPVHEAIVFLADRVAENSDGKLTIDIYANGQLGSERQCLELLQIGSLGMTKVSSAVMENFSPQLRVFGYPYLFRDNEHRFNVYDGDIGQKLLEDGEKYWLRGLTYFDAGSRSFYTKTKAIETPDDLIGMKIRVMQSPTAIEMVKTLGAAPTPISFGELYTAIQQGVVDGAENNLPSFYTSGHYEVCKFYSIDEHSSVPDILVIGTLAWSNLTEIEKEWLMDAVKETTVFQRKLWAEAEKEALFEIEKAGVAVNRPDKSLFVAKSQEMITVLKDRDEALYQLVQEIKQAE